MKKNMIFYTKNNMMIHPSTIDIWSVHVDDEQFKGISLFTKYVSWRNKYINNNYKATIIQKSDITKIIFIEDIFDKKEREFYGHATEEIYCKRIIITLVTDWLRNRLNAIESTLFRFDLQEIQSETIDRIEYLRQKLENNVEIIPQDIAEINGIVEKLTQHSEKMREIIRLEKKKQISYNLGDFMTVWKEVNEYSISNRILYTGEKFVHVDKKLPKRISKFLENSGYKVILTGKIETVEKLSELFNLGMIEIHGPIAKVDDSVDLDVIDYLKNEMHFIIEAL